MPAFAGVGAMSTGSWHSGQQTFMRLPFAGQKAGWFEEWQPTPL